MRFASFSIGLFCFTLRNEQTTANAIEWTSIDGVFLFSGNRGEKWKQHMKKQNERRSMCALKLGSLFDGIGVFPLAASRNGIIPVWASEIEKSPIAITKRHFPDMEHLGDITKIHGGNIPPVHIITFGSPCQNLSKIGKREGLAGSKSGLFFRLSEL